MEGDEWEVGDGTTRKMNKEKKGKRMKTEGEDGVSERGVGTR